MEKEKLKKVIEGALFASGQALNIEKLSALFLEEERPEAEAISAVLLELQEDYANRGVILKEVASGYRFQVCEDTGEWVSRLWEEKPARYSRALLETLALVGYRQPVTRGEIEEIRGVSTSSQIMKTLLERDWVRIVGHRDVPGRPAMYATTRTFLDYFNLKNLDELPSLSEIRDLDQINAELDLIHPDLVMKLPVELPASDSEGADEGNEALDKEAPDNAAQNDAAGDVENSAHDTQETEPDEEDSQEPLDTDIPDANVLEVIAQESAGESGNEQVSEKALAEDIANEPSFVPPVELPPANHAPLNDEAFDKPGPSLSPFSASIEALRKSDAERRASSEIKKATHFSPSAEQEEDDANGPDLSEQSAEALVIDEYIERQIEATGSVSHTIELDESDLKTAKKSETEEPDH